MADMSNDSTIAPANSARLEPYVRYDDAVALRVVMAYADGKSLRKIAKMPGMPARSAISEWEQERPEFRAALARARARKAEWHAERGAARLARVDTDSPFGGARVSKAREQAAYDKWMAACLDRPAWGEQVQHNVTAVVALVAFPDLTPRPLAAVSVDPSLPIAPMVPESKYEPA